MGLLGRGTGRRELRRHEWRVFSWRLVLGACVRVGVGWTQVAARRAGTHEFAVHGGRQRRGRVRVCSELLLLLYVGPRAAGESARRAVEDCSGERSATWRVDRADGAAGVAGDGWIGWRAGV